MISNHAKLLLVALSLQGCFHYEHPPSDLIAQIMRDSPDAAFCKSTTGANEDHWVMRRKDLNDDGRVEFIVESSGGCMCGNEVCGTWIYESTSAGTYRSIHVGVTSEWFTSERTNGYLDIREEGRGYKKIWRVTTQFRNGAYTDQVCESANTKTGKFNVEPCPG